MFFKMFTLYSFFAFSHSCKNDFFADHFKFKIKSDMTEGRVFFLTSFFSVVFLLAYNYNSIKHQEIFLNSCLSFQFPHV